MSAAADLSLDALRAITGAAGVISDAGDLAPYCTDWRHLFHGKALCAGLPRSTEQVAAVVRLCRAAGVAVVPHGGNTGLSGGATPDASGQQLVLSLARMNAIRDIDPIGETMELEAGVVLQTAQEGAAEVQLLLPISLAAEGSALIGGVISTNAGGTNVVRYGMARGRVLGLEVVTAQGEIISGLRRLRKDNAGYDWKQWFIGSEGTLGIVTAAVLQLAPLPRHRVTALLAVPSADAALQLLYNVIVPAETDAAALNTLVHDLVVAQGGSISAEHGVGQYRVGELERCRSAPELALARRLKHALDPEGLLNPGKVLARQRTSG